jgi:hypothetical protein
MKKEKQKEQLTLNLEQSPIQQKRFNITAAVNAKLDNLEANIHKLTFAEIVWLSRLEDFFIKTEYLTERQIGILDVMAKTISNNR